ncbi:MAG: ABC transporter substrate-binding protein [Candidatus Caldarchaeum sp.]
MKPEKKSNLLKIIALVVVVAVAAAVALVFFGGVVQPTSTTRVEEVRIGVLTPLSGGAAYFGEGQKAMAELMAKKVNSEGGIKSLGGAKVRVIVADTEGKPEVGKAQAARLINEEKVHLIIGALHSGVTSPASIEAERAGIPWICETSSHPELTKRGFKWFFRVWGHDEIFARQYFELLKDLQQEKGVKFNTIAFVSEESLFAIGVRSEWEKLNLDPNIGGYRVVARVNHPSGVKDLTSEALILKQANPDIVLMVNTPIPDAILWTQTLKRVDFFPKVLMTTGGFSFKAYIDGVGADSNYIIGRGAVSMDMFTNRPAAKEVYDWFTRETGKEFHVYVATMYTAMLVAIDSLERAGSVEPEKLRQAIADTNLPAEKMVLPWQGVKFDSTGQNVYAVDPMSQIINGEFRIVWPKSSRVIEPVFPAPSWKERT